MPEAQKPAPVTAAPAAPPPAANEDVVALAPDDRIAEQLDRIMKEKGTEGGLSVLYNDNLDVRHKNGKLRELVADARARLPVAGSVVLTGAEAEAHHAIVALGVPLTEVAERLKTGRGSEAETRAANLEQQKVHGTAAALLKWKPDLLTELATDKGITIAVIDGEEGDGDEKRTVKVPVVVPAEGDPVLLAEYAPLKPYHPALRSDAEAEAAPTKPATPNLAVPRVLKQSSGVQGTKPQPDIAALVEQARATGAYSKF